MEAPPPVSLQTHLIGSEKNKGAECLRSRNFRGGQSEFLLPCVSSEAETPTESLPEPEGAKEKEADEGGPPRTPPAPQDACGELPVLSPAAPSPVSWERDVDSQMR